jgi:hypothetical protein
MIITIYFPVETEKKDTMPTEFQSWYKHKLRNNYERSNNSFAVYICDSLESKFLDGAAWPIVNLQTGCETQILLFVSFVFLYVFYYYLTAFSSISFQGRWILKEILKIPNGTLH